MDLPDDLLSAKRWVAWRFVDRGGAKPTKVPYSPVTGGGAKADDPSTWGTLEQAQSVKRKDGIGIMLGDLGDGTALCGLDLDGCRDERTDTLTDWANDLLDGLETYSEVSPSQKGVKALFRLPVNKLETISELTKTDYGKSWRKSKAEAIELHWGHRYYAITGETVDRRPVRDLEFSQIRDLIGKTGPAFAGRAEAKEDAPREKDGSGSGALFDLASRLCNQGDSRDDFAEAAWDDADSAAHLDKQVDQERAINRAWAKVKARKLVRDLSLAGYHERQVRSTIHADPEIGDVLTKDSIDTAIDYGFRTTLETTFEDLDAVEEDRVGKPFFEWYDNPNPADLPRRDFIFGHAFIRGFVSTTIAPGGVGKTALTISEAVAMVHGLPFMGDHPDRPLKAAVWNTEDGKDEMRKRIAAAQLNFSTLLAKVKGFDIRKSLVLHGSERSLIVARMGKDGRIIINEKLVERLIDECRAADLDVLFVDPLISTMEGIPENDNNAMDAVVKRVWGRIAREAAISVMLVHHTRKPGQGVRGSYAVEDARGASALISAARYARVLNKMSEREGVELGVSKEHLWQYIRVDSGKTNLSPPGSAVWRRLVNVRLPNGDFENGKSGDEVGVAEPWIPPERGEVGHDERDIIVRVLGTDIYREDHRSSNWVGRAIAAALELDLTEVSSPLRVKAVLQRGLKEGWLKRCTVLDEKRRKRTGILAAKFGDADTDDLVG